MYAFAFYGSTANTNATWTMYGVQSLVSIGSNLGFMLTNDVLQGFSVSSLGGGGLPSNIPVTNTSGYVRTGVSVYQQPWILFEGT